MSTPPNLPAVADARLNGHSLKPNLVDTYTASAALPHGTDTDILDVKLNGDIKINGPITIAAKDASDASNAGAHHPIKQFLLAHPATGNYEIASNIPSMSSCEVYNWLLDAVKSGEVDYQLGKYSLVSK